MKNQNLQVENIAFWQQHNEAQVVRQDLRQIVPDTSVHPYNAIGKLKCLHFNEKLKKNQIQFGSGCIINSRLILTSAHVLYFKQTRTVADSIQFFPEQLLRAKEPPKSGIKAIKVFLKYDYVDKKDKQSKYDFAFILLQENSIITEEQSIRLNFEYKFEDHAQKIINVAGYAGTFKAIANSQLYEENPAVKEEKGFLLYRHTTDGGNSGGPVLLKLQDGTYQAVGIHKGSIMNYNYAILLRDISQTMGLATRHNSKDMNGETLMKILEQQWQECYMGSFRKYNENIAELRDQLNLAKQQNLILKRNQWYFKSKISQKQLRIESLQMQLHDQIEKISKQDMEIQSLQEKNKKIKSAYQDQVLKSYINSWNEYYRLQKNYEKHIKNMESVGVSGYWGYYKATQDFIKQAKEELESTYKEMDKKIAQKLEELKTMKTEKELRELQLQHMKNLKINPKDPDLSQIKLQILASQAMNSTQSNKQIAKYMIQICQNSFPDIIKCYDPNRNRETHGYPSTQKWKQKYDIYFSQNKFYLDHHDKEVDMAIFVSKKDWNHLEFVDFDECGVDDLNFRVFVDNWWLFNNLKVVNLESNQITQVKEGDLEKFRSLQLINLSQNPLSEKSKLVLQVLTLKKPSLKIIYDK